MFTPEEIAYLQSQPLGRLGTLSPTGSPRVVPVGFDVDAASGTIVISGYHLDDTSKWKAIQRDPRVAFVVDDIVSTNPWTVRMMEIRGHAETLSEGGKQINPAFGDAVIRITPDRIASFGIAGSPSGTRTFVEDASSQE